MPDLTAVFLVGTFESECSNCRQPTLVYGITHHVDVAGWSGKPGEGCGAEFVGIASNHPRVTAADLERMRPDLPVVPRPA
jgi:hypothetical protein